MVPMPSRLGKSYKEPWLIVCAVLKVCLSVPFLRSSLNIYYVLSSHHRAAKNFPVLLHYLQNKIQTTYPYIRGLTLVILFPIFTQPQPTHTHTHTHMLQTWVSESWVSTCKYHSFFWTYLYALVLPRVPLPSLCNKYFTTTSPKTQTHKQICSIYRFPWRKHSHYGQFQLTNVVSLNAELGRDEQRPTMMKYLYHHFINKIKQSQEQDSGGVWSN